jgi:Flp pilus assembly protein TadD
LKAKILILVAVFVLLATSALAQVRLSGQVNDPDGKPVEGAVVKLTSVRVAEMEPVKTDRRGRWAALVPLGGPWDIDIEKEGYLTFRGTVNASERGRMPPLNSVLERRAPQVEEVEVEVPIVSTVPAEAVEAVETAERLVRRAEGRATAADLEAMGLDAGAGSPSAEDRAALYKAAVGEFEKAHALLPEHVEIKKALARAYYASGDTAPAIRLLTEVLEEEPENVGIALVVVNLLAEEGNLEGARRTLDRVPASALTDPTPIINVGILFLNRKNAEEAHRYFDRAVAIDPMRGETYYYRAIAALQLERRADGKADLEKVVSLAPDSSEASDARELLDQMN